MRSSLSKGSAALIATSLALSTLAPLATFASSHREAPMISQDPAADATDVYAFVAPDAPTKVVLIANSNPIGLTGAGPNYFNFATDVVYAIHVDNNADAKADITYAFTFTRKVKNGNTFLYNTQPYSKIDDGNVTYTANAYRIDGKWTPSRTMLTKKNLVASFKVAPPPMGDKSQPDYLKLMKEAVYDGGSKGMFFAGTVNDPFFVDLAVFDLLNMKGNNTIAGTNVQSIALKVDVKSLLKDGKDAAKSSDPVIAVWNANYRDGTRVLKTDGTVRNAGKLVQISRLGMPLVNEVVVPLAYKDYFNGSDPAMDAKTPAYLQVVTQPELAGLFKAVLGLDVPLKDRTDLVSVFLTGVKDLTMPKSANAVAYEALRLNTAVAPAKAGEAKRLGVLEGDLAGFPNGRRLSDDVTDIAIQAVAGILVPAYAKKVPATLGDGVNTDDKALQSAFPYMASPK